MRTAALVALLVVGCLGRSVPVPPPVVQAVEVSDCPVAQCPGGGVIPTLRGTGVAGALLIVEDTHPDRRRATGEVLGGQARIAVDGTFRVVVTPLWDPRSGTVLAARRGDVLAVFQLTPGPDGEASNAVSVTVP